MPNPRRHTRSNQARRMERNQRTTHHNSSGALRPYRPPFESSWGQEVPRRSLDDPRDLNERFHQDAERQVEILSSRYATEEEGNRALTMDEHLAELEGGIEARRRQRRIDIEYELYQEPDRPIGKLCGKLPVEGYDGEKRGLVRCELCKSWHHPSRLEAGYCQFCSEIEKEEKAKESK